MAIQPPPVPADPRRVPNQIPPTPKAMPPQPPPAAPAQDAAAAEPSPDALSGIAPENPDVQIQEEQPHQEHINFWQQPFVQNVLPFLTSLVLHIGVIVFGYMMIKVGQA